MKTARTAAAVVAPVPSVYEHSTQPQWGRAVVAASLTDRATYVFENAGERTFMKGYTSIVEVQLAPEEREALAKRLLRGHATATAAATKKKSSKAAKGATKKKAPAERPPAAREREEEPGSFGSDDE